MKRRLAMVVVAAGLASCNAPYEDAPGWRPASAGGEGAHRELTRPEGGEAVGEPAEGKALTLAECLALAQARSRDIWVADRRVLIARDRTAEAFGKVLPQARLEARYDWRSNEPGATFNGIRQVTGEQDTFSARAFVLVPIYDFGSTLRQWDAEKSRILAGEHSARRERQDVALAVAQAYFRFLEARKIRDVVQESIETVERQLSVSRDFLEAGIVSRSDVLTAEVQRAERRQELIRAENNIELARGTLNRLLGFELERPTEVEDVLEAPPLSVTLAVVLRRAVERRADLSSLREEVRARQAEWESIQRSRLPALFGTAEYNYRKDDFLLEDNWFAAGLGINVPVFDGFSTDARARRKEKEIAEAIDQHDERVDDILLDVRRAWLLAREAAQRLPVAALSVELATENLRVMRDRYAEGLVSSTDVLIEEDRLSRARSGRVQALYDAHAAQALLENATGGSEVP